MTKTTQTNETETPRYSQEDLELLSQTRQERNRGRQSVQKIRNDFIEEDRIFIDQEMNKESIGDTTFFDVVWAFMARTFIEKPKATFKSKKFSLLQQQFIDNLNSVKDTDIESQEMEEFFFQVNYDKYRYGGWFWAMTWWDANEKRPTFEVIAPSQIVPDPDWDYVTGEYKFFWFETLKRKEDLPDNYNKDVLTRYAVQTGNKISEQQSVGIIDVSNDTEDPIYDVYYHFTIFKGIKYMVVTTSGEAEMLYKEKIEVIKGSPEEKDNNLVPFPIMIDNWKKDRRSPFGQRLAVICKNAQNAITIIQNLRYKKSKAELFPMYLRNIARIPRAEDMMFGFNKIVGVKGDWPLSEAMMPVPRDTRSDTSERIEMMIQSNLSRSTGGINSNIALGETPETRETLGVQNMVAESRNVGLTFDDKISTWFYRRWLKLWLRSYIINFEDWDTKIASIGQGGFSASIELKKQDFLKFVNVTVSIRSSSEVKTEKFEKKQQLTQMFTLLATIQRSETEIKNQARDIFEASDIPSEEVDRYLAYSPQETMQQNENILLMEWEMLPINPDDDHLAHMMMMPKIIKDFNEATILHYMAHNDAFIKWGSVSPSLVGWDENASNIQQGIQGGQIAQSQTTLDKNLAQG